MRDYRDAKVKATTLRQALRDKQVSLSHSECLEIVAQQFGLKNWNVLADRIRATPTTPAPGLSRPVGWSPSGTRSDLYEMGSSRHALEGSPRGGHPLPLPGTTACL